LARSAIRPSRGCWCLRSICTQPRPDRADCQLAGAEQRRHRQGHHRRDRRLAKVGDNLGVTKVVFKVDGTTLNIERYAPRNCIFDTTKVADGTHTVTATAYDAAGNSSSAQVHTRIHALLGENVLQANTPTPSGPCWKKSASSACPPR
jgi:hypothetical protein